MKAIVGAFNQEKALVGAFSVIVKTEKTDGSFAALVLSNLVCDGSVPACLLSGSRPSDSIIPSSSPPHTRAGYVGPQSFHNHGEGYYYYYYYDYVLTTNNDS